MLRSDLPALALAMADFGGAGSVAPCVDGLNDPPGPSSGAYLLEPLARWEPDVPGPAPYPTLPPTQRGLHVPDPGRVPVTGFTTEGRLVTPVPSHLPAQHVQQATEPLTRAQHRASVPRHGPLARPPG